MPRGIPKERGVLDQLIKSHFMATDNQIELLARLNLTSIQGLDNVRGAYLKSLISGVQRAVKPGKKSGSLVAETLDAIHERFYAAVMRGVVTKEIADLPELSQEERTARSLERNRRSNFARTAKNAVANFIKAGGDIFQLDAMTVTKVELHTFVMSMRARAAGGPTLEHKTKLAAERLEESFRELADDDKDKAIQSVQEAMARMANLLTELGIESTTKTTVAVRDHKMLRLPEGSFWPMGKAIAPRESTVQ